MNNCPTNILEILLLLERYHQNSQAVLAATGMNGLRISSGVLTNKIQQYLFQNNNFCG